MKKATIFALVLLVIVGGVLLHQHYLKQSRVLGASTEKPAIKIGAVLTLTGDLGSLGEEINKGALIALDEAKQQGLNIQYIAEDDHSQPKDSVTAASKLINLDKMPVVFAANFQQVKPMVSVFENSKVPLLATWDFNDYIKNAGPYIFSTGFGTEAAGETMAEYAYTTLGARKLAIISHKDEWAELINGAFAKKFTTLGGTIVMKEETGITETNYRTLIAKAKALEADSIYFPMEPPVKGPFLKEVKELGFKGTLITGDGFLQDEINDTGAAAENVYYTNTYATDVEQMNQKYQAKYGAQPYDPVFAGFGYDAIKTILAAYDISAAKTLSLRDALTQVHIEGVDAPIHMDGKQYSEKLEKIFKVVNGKPELVQ